MNRRSRAVPWRGAGRDTWNFAAMEVATDVGDEAEVNDEYTWEGLYERSWEAVEETIDGSLRSVAHAHRRREAQAVQLGVRRGVMRYVIIALDCSKHAADPDNDMRPTRIAVMISAAKEFVTAFFDQNPISSLSVLVIRDGRAEALTPASCNARQHTQARAAGRRDARSHIRPATRRRRSPPPAMRAPARARRSRATWRYAESVHVAQALDALSKCSGEASLQNALELARSLHDGVATFISRELILLSASLASCDPGDIHETIKNVVASKVGAHVSSRTCTCPHAPAALAPPRRTS